MPNQSLWIPIGIEHGKEMRQELAAGIFKREILLVIAHHRDQHFLWKREELRIKAAENDRRKFCQVHDGTEQWIVFAPARAGNRTRRGIERFANLRFALRTAEDFCETQRIDIGRACLRNRDDAVGKNPMSPRSLPCSHAVELERNRLAV